MIEHGSRAWRYIDKRVWGEGPWLLEPDKEQWVDPGSDLDCMIRRNPDMGNLCGYVGVPPGHPLYEQGYYDIEDEIDVHGGLTFANLCDGDEERGICHVPLPGREPEVWWLGFDCGHGWDLIPGLHRRIASLDPALARELGGVYRDMDYVREQVRHLARQLKEAA